MHSSLTAIVLCMFAQAASAQCTATTAPAQDVHPTATTARATGTPRPAQAAPHGGPELIKTAAASTRDDDAPPVARETATRGPAGTDHDHPRRGGTAMLLAALALMSGIALRRYGGPPR
jgi:hypothetical protein